jgi:hypothetical protein
MTGVTFGVWGKYPHVTIQGLDKASAILKTTQFRGLANILLDIAYSSKKEDNYLRFTGNDASEGAFPAPQHCVMDQTIELYIL